MSFHIIPGVFNRQTAKRIMSTDFTVVDDETKTYWHLGQRMATKYSFGYGSNDAEGISHAAEKIVDHLRLGKSLRIVLTDDIPEGYSKEKIDESEDTSRQPPL